MIVSLDSRRYERDLLTAVRSFVQSPPSSSKATFGTVGNDGVTLLCFVTDFSFTARGHAHEGMYSDLRPLFDQIDKYYEEINVSLRAEEHYLKTIRKTLRVTPDDKLRWEHIRDACQDACRLLTTEVKYMRHIP